MIGENEAKLHKARFAWELNPLKAVASEHNNAIWYAGAGLQFVLHSAGILRGLGFKPVFEENESASRKGSEINLIPDMPCVAVPAQLPRENHSLWFKALEYSVVSIRRSESEWLRAEQDSWAGSNFMRLDELRRRDLLILAAGVLYDPARTSIRTINFLQGWHLVARDYLFWNALWSEALWK